jgi:hypothetical protein
MRGSDSTIHPDGQGVFAKVVNGFVRFQGNLTNTMDTPFTLFRLPSGQGMIPAKTVYVPISLCPLASSVAGRIVINTNGDVVVEGSSADAWCGVSLDGASYSMASSSGSQPISLSSGWVPYSTRAVRVRTDNGGVVRLEGAVKNGTTNTIGTLPSGKRPGKTIYVAANGIFNNYPSVLSINSLGIVKVLWPPMLLAPLGISLDGVSFAL